LQTEVAQHPTYEFDGYRLDPARRSLTHPDGHNAKLVGRPFDTLLYLVEHAGEIVDRGALVEAVGAHRIVEDNNLNQAIAVLRRLLGERHIVTVPGRGYQFVTPVRRIVTAEQRNSVEPTAGPAPRPLSGDATAPTAHRERRPAWTRPAIAAVLATGIGAGALWSASDSALSPSAAPWHLRGVVPVTSYPGEETTPALSPDGKLVAFSRADDAGRTDLYVTQLGTGATMRLTESGAGHARHPAWSPDGKWIAFLREHDQARFDLVVIPAIGGPERVRYAGDRFWISVEGYPLLAWTPDGRELWFTTRLAKARSERRFGLHRLTLATGVVTALDLGNDGTAYDTSPTISPDGRRLAFTRFHRGERLNRVFVQSLGPGVVPLGKPQPLANLEPAIYHSLSWSAAGDRLRFASGSQLLEWDGAAVRVAHTVGPASVITAMTMVENGTAARAAMVDVRRDVDLLAVPLDPTTHAALGPLGIRAKSTTVEQHPRFSPDGNLLAFVSDRSGDREVWVAGRDGENARQLTDMAELIVGYPRWSPDGSRIAFHASTADDTRTIYAVEVDTGATTRLFNGCCPGGWSADGQWLYATEIGPRNQVQRIDVASGRRETLFEGEGATESADGRYLLYSRSAEPGYFRRLVPAHPGSSVGPEERLVTDYVPSRGGLAPVADGFFYLGLTPSGEPRAIRFYDYELREARDIVVPAPADVAYGLTASPDGRELLLAGTAGPRETDVVVLEFDRTPPPLASLQSSEK
jgi:Tol biopolymer transport system component/DNA-binding winged helix-turn-helix (wHTH) protein